MRSTGQAEVQAHSAEPTLAAGERLAVIYAPHTVLPAVTAFLDSQFERGAICPANHWQNLADLPATEVSRFRLFRGQFYFALLCNLLPEPPAVAMMLREPNARALAEYLHWKDATAPTPDGSTHKNLKPELLDYLTDEWTIRKSKNLQTRLLATVFDLSAPQALPDAVREARRLANDMDMKLARERLDAMLFGLSERTQDSLFLFAYTFGWPAYVDYAIFTDGVERKLATLSPRDSDGLAALNTTDSQLYSYAQRVFETRYTAMVDNLMTAHGTRAHARLKRPLDAEVLRELLEKDDARRHPKPDVAAPPSPAVREDSPGGDATEYTLHKDDQLVFIHIPKTAGVSFSAALERQFHPTTICTEKNPRGLLSHPSGHLPRYRLIRGHFSYSIREILGRDPVFVTLLRDPVERTLSQYAYTRQSSRAFRHEFVAEQDMSLMDFISDEQVALSSRNLQTRYIASGEFLGFGPGPRRHLGLEVAIQRLSTFAFVGLTERFEESLHLLSYTLGWPPAVGFERHNVTPHRPRREVFPAETIEHIIELNRLDLDLYAFGKALFERRYEQMTHELLARYGTRAHAQLAPPLDADVMHELLTRHYEARRNRSKLFVLLEDAAGFHRIAGTVRYYRDFPTHIEPFLPRAAGDEVREVYTGPGGVYGTLRRGLLSTGLLRVARRLIGLRFIMSARYFFQYGESENRRASG